MTKQLKISFIDIRNRNVISTIWLRIHTMRRQKKTHMQNKKSHKIISISFCMRNSNDNANWILILCGTFIANGQSVEISAFKFNLQLFLSTSNTRSRSVEIVERFRFYFRLDIVHHGLWRSMSKHWMRYWRMFYDIFVKWKLRSG